MTDREKAIVMAYTGTCMLAGDNLGIFYQYVQEKLGHCIMTHELAYPEVQDAIKEAARDDFIELCRQSDEPRVMTLDEVLRLKFDDVVFFEMSVAGVVISAIVIDVIEHMPDGDIGLIQFRHIQEPTNNADLEYYGKTWRCWTSRPDEKRREETPWE